MDRDAVTGVDAVIDKDLASALLACELGADAVIVTRDFLVSTERGPDRKLVAGIAIKYRDSPGASKRG